MPSNSIKRWTGEGARALDEIDNAHARVGGRLRGRRFATQQLNYAYAALLSSHFQRFCRDLHSESVDHIAGLVPTRLQALLRAEFVWSRSLDKGNPHPGAIGSDFMRLGIDFWAEVYRLGALNKRRRELLQELNEWRNAIVHQDFVRLAPGGGSALGIARVRGWRRALGALADSFDQAMYNYLTSLLHAPPW